MNKIEAEAAVALIKSDVEGIHYPSVEDPLNDGTDVSVSFGFRGLAYEFFELCEVVAFVNTLDMEKQIAAFIENKGEIE